MSRVTVIGAGYVGLVTAGGLAHLGHDVCCIDVDASKIAQLNAGEIPIHEAGLQELVAAGRTAGRLRFRVGHDQQSEEAEFFFLCVPTPEAADGAANVSYLEAAARTLAQVVTSGATIVNKSTVPVGSTSLVEAILDRDDVFVVSNPEFLREGSAVQDFLHPDRIVIGAENDQAAARVKHLYHDVDTEFLLTDPVSSELIKYAANSFLATKLSFINAVAAICEQVDADISDVRKGMGLDHRIGLDYLAPGPAWGGSCFPKDTGAMLRIAADAGYDFALVRAAIETNEGQLDRVAARVVAALGRQEVSLDEATVCLLGIAFKAGTDDIRQSPALAVAQRLRSAGVAAVHGYDPVAVAPPEQVSQSSGALEACTDAQVVVVMTEWPEFAELDMTAVRTAMRGDTIVDTRHILDPARVHAAGLRLEQLGRATS